MPDTSQSQNTIAGTAFWSHTCIRSVLRNRNGLVNVTVKIAVAVAMLISAGGVADAAGPSVEPVLGLDTTGDFKLKMSLTQMNDFDLIVSVAELTTAQRIPKPARKLYSKALKADERGQTREAIDQLQSAIDLAPKYFQVHAALAVGYLKVGLTHEAEREIELALQLNPSYRPGLEIQGIIWFVQGKFTVATAALRAAAKQNPNHVLTHHYLGLALLRMGLSDEADRHLQQADELLRHPPQPLLPDFEPWNPFPPASRPWNSCGLSAWRSYPATATICAAH